MKAGCNAFLPSLVSNPGWFASIYSPETPEIGLQAALVGQPEQLSVARLRDGRDRLSRLAAQDCAAR